MLGLDKIVTNRNNKLSELTFETAVMLVFLRHFGCIFCREALSELSNKQNDFDRLKIKVIFVHMTDYETADSYFEEYAFDQLEHISDPNCEIYKNFGLTKGSVSQLFGLSTWVRGFQLTAKGIPITTKSIGDSFQMPGIFILHNNKIQESYIHSKVSEKPDYEKLLNCCKDIQ